MEKNCDNRSYSCVNIPSWIFMIDGIATNINKDLTIIKNCGSSNKLPELMYFMTLSSLIFSKNCTKTSSNRVKVSLQIAVLLIIESYFLLQCIIWHVKIIGELPHYIIQFVVVLMMIYSLSHNFDLNNISYMNFKFKLILI